MAERMVVYALRRKYGELKGLIKHHPEQDHEATFTALRQVGCVLRMFKPDEDLTVIAAVRPHKPERSRLWTREALRVLREAGEPMTTREIARVIAKAHGIMEETTLFSIECSLHSTLERRRGRGIERLEGAPKRWRVATG